jgi:hypothetical protein
MSMRYAHLAPEHSQDAVDRFSAMSDQGDAKADNATEELQIEK